MEEKELLKKLEEASEKANKAFQDAPPGMDYEGFMDYMAEANEPLMVASRNYRLVQTPEFEEIPKYGDVMTLDDFIECCDGGGFIDYDGSGNYATEDHMTNISINPSDVDKGTIRKDFYKIVWFNR